MVAVNGETSIVKPRMRVRLRFYHGVKTVSRIGDAGGAGFEEG